MPRYDTNEGTGEIFLATLKMVANRANVSVMTVSRVLNDPQCVSDKTKERVLQAIAELNYRPNEAARIMKGKRSNILGVLVPDLDNPFHTRFLDMLEETVTPMGYRLLIASSVTGGGLVENLKYMLSRSVDAIVISPCSNVAEASRYILDSCIGVPVVIADRVEPQGVIHSVYTDGYAGVKQMVEHLIGLGHKRIATIKGTAGYQTTVDRFRGYRDAMEEHGLPIDPAYIFEGEYTVEAGIQAAKYFLSLKNRPTAIVTPSDVIAVGVIHAIQKTDCRIPEDLSVTGCDGIYLGDLITPTLTTCNFSIQGIAKKVAEIIIDELDNGKNRCVTAGFQGTLKLRNSTGPAPK